MAVNVRNKLRIALGSVKDHASIGKAMIYNRDGLSGIEIAVLRATGHDNTPIDDQNMHEILFLVSNSPGSVPYLAERISHRLDRTRDKIVALKTLVLVHRLLRGGNRSFEHDLHNAHLSGYLQMNTRWFTTNSDHSISFLQSYASFLEERIGWVINQAGKLEPIILQEKCMELVFHKLPKYQVFFDKVLSCLPLEISSSSDCLTLAAMRNLLRETFQVYAVFCEGVATLVDCFFNYKHPSRVISLDILNKASRQSYELYDFFEICKKTIGIKNLDYPSVQIITPFHVSSMEQFLNCSPTSTSNSSFSKRGMLPCLINISHTKPTESQAHLKGNIREEVKEETATTSSPIFSCRLETIISTIWVVFDEEETQSSHFSLSKLDHHAPAVGYSLPAERKVTGRMGIQQEIPYNQGL